MMAPGPNPSKSITASEVERSYGLGGYVGIIGALGLGDDHVAPGI